MSQLFQIFTDFSVLYTSLIFRMGASLSIKACLTQRPQGNSLSGLTAARKQLLRPNDSTQTEAAAQSDSLRKSQIQVFDSQSFIVFIVGILHTFGAILIEIN